MNVYIETYGCQMNKLDSEIVASILLVEDFTIVKNILDADVILLNTCGVRENAEIRIHGRVAELSALKKDHPSLIFGIIGCMAQRLKKSLLSNGLKIIAGPDSYRKLPEMIRKAAVEPVVDTVLESQEIYGDIEPARTDSFSAWVAVIRGCNNFCSYCIVPYVRGGERSIPLQHIIEEIKHLREQGYREVTLLGQNVNAYRNNGIDFAGLLREVAFTGMEWIRFLTSHPKNLTEHILEVMVQNKNICPHLHLPLQSGSDRILKAMNRGYTVAEYLAHVQKAREIVDGISLTTDLIFGFPGETEEDFQKTLSVMRTVRFDHAFLYHYSEREGTKASYMSGNVPKPVRIERLKEAIELQRKHSCEQHNMQVNTSHVVLVKDTSKDRRGWFGYTETNIPVVFTSDKNNVDIGSFVNVQIEATSGSTLIGRNE